MDEVEARAWIEARVPRETFVQLGEYVRLLRTEAPRQNLISASTTEQIWARHIVDCAQIAFLPTSNQGDWADLGSGAGLPGLVVAIIRLGRVICVEPRRLRANFLDRVIAELGLSERATVVHAHATTPTAQRPCTTISARALAPLSAIFDLGSGWSVPHTTWILPKGRSVERELATARETWQGAFELVPSVTDPTASIVVARNLRRRPLR